MGLPGGAADRAGVALRSGGNMGWDGASGGGEMWNWYLSVNSMLDSPQSIAALIVLSGAQMRRASLSDAACIFAPFQCGR
jgi:hypothetical protein